jgi:hypothetical protein
MFEVRYNYVDLKQTFRNNRNFSENRFPPIFSISDVSVFKLKNILNNTKITINKNIINNVDYLDKIHYPIKKTVLPNKNFEKNCLGKGKFIKVEFKTNKKMKGKLKIIGYGHQIYVINAIGCFEISFIAKPIDGYPKLTLADSGTPIYLNNKLHSFFNGFIVKGDIYFLTPANLVLKQVEKFIGKKCFFCDLSVINDSNYNNDDNNNDNNNNDDNNDDDDDDNNYDNNNDDNNNDDNNYDNNNENNLINNNNHNSNNNNNKNNNINENNLINNNDNNNTNKNADADSDNLNILTIKKSKSANVKRNTSNKAIIYIGDDQVEK